MNIHEKQIEHLLALRPFLTADGKYAVDESIERERLREQIARDYGMSIRV